MTSWPTPTSLPVAVIQPPSWDPATIYGVVFGIVTAVLGIPGAWAGVHVLRKRFRAAALDAEAEPSDRLEASPTVIEMNVIEEERGDVRK